MDISSMLMVLLTAVIAVSSWFALPLPWARLIIRLGRRYARLHSRSLVCDGLEWHYLEGNSGPLLLLLHGFGGDADNWLKVSRDLAKDFRVLAPDLPGFGSSDRPQNASFEIDTQLLRLQKFLEQLDERPEFVAGNSMGGWLATAYAATQPEKLAGLWLLAPLGVRSANQSPMLSAIERGEKSPLQVSELHTFTCRVLEPMFGHLPWVPYPLRVFYGKLAIERSKSATSDFRQLIRSQAALEDLAPSVHIPVLLQWGTRDFAVDVSGAAVLKQMFSRIEVHTQQGVGHLPMLETPKASVRFFKAFHRRCAASSASASSEIGNRP